MADQHEQRPHGRHRAVDISTRVYRALLRAYPREMRGQYGAEMARCFRDLCQQALGDAGGLGLAALWARTLPELLATACKERSVMTARRAYRIAVGIALVTTFFLVWTSLAIGLIGSENNPLNLLYGAVLAVGIIGAIIAHARPEGMARVLCAMALTQASVPVVALLIGNLRVSSMEALMGVLGVLGVNAFFVVLFAGSAVLFRYAAREHPPASAGPEG
jgi:hypothetical protein